MITKAQYFGNKPYPIEHEANADKMLAAVNCLLHEAAESGVYDYEEDPDTGTQISGAKGGAGDGGYRLPDSTTGKGKSNHKTGRSVDVYDPIGKLNAWITRTILIKHGLYREHPDSTLTWCHLQDVPPGSGCRTYKP